jgi:hypothetical protein
MTVAVDIGRSEGGYLRARGEVLGRCADLEDPRTPDNEESHVIRRCQELYAQFTDEEREVFELRLADKTLDETAARLQAQGRCCGTSKVSYVRKRIREKLLTL